MLESHACATADPERVSLQSLLRGGPALYSVPPHLMRLLPLATRKAPAQAAECWAGAVMARVLRLRA